MRAVKISALTRIKMTERPNLLNEQVVEKFGTFERVIRWYKGWHPEIRGSILIIGLTGKETRVEKSIIRPSYTFKVNGK